MYYRSKRKNSNEVSINEPIDTDSEGNPLTLIDIISVDDTIIEDIDKNLKIKKLYKYIEALKDEREKNIIIMRYGLYGTRALTQKQVADRLDISRSYVSRIEKRVLEKLRKKLE